MKLNPFNWFEIQKKRVETRQEILKVSGKSANKALEEPEKNPEGMKDLLKAIKEGNLSELSLDEGSIGEIAKGEQLKQLKKNLKNLNAEASQFTLKKKELVKEYHEQSKDHYEYQKTHEELAKLDGLKDETDRAIFEILKNGKGEGFTSADEHKLHEYEKIKKAISSRFKKLEQEPETALHVRMHTLDTYHTQLIKGNYIETPSRTEYIDWIKDQMKNHRSVLLEGATGTGKTELLLHTSKTLLGKEHPELLPGNPHVTKYDLLGSQGLESDEHGTKTTDKPGYLPRAMKDGNVLILDEMNQIETKVRFALKPFYRYSGTRSGDAMVEGVKYPVNDGFLIAATANLKGDKHKDRFDLDPAESRVFAMKHIEYPPQHEMYDMALAALRKSDGTYIIGKESAESTLKGLVDATHEIQEGYEKALASSFDPGAGTKKTSLEKAVLDPGEFMAMVKSYAAAYASGKTFEDHINARLADFTAKGAYPEKDRVLLAKVLKSKGFITTVDANVLHLTDSALVESLNQWPTAEGREEIKSRGTMTERQAAALDPYELRKEMIAKVAEEFVAMASPEEKKAREASTEKSMWYQEAMEAIGKENFLGPEEVRKCFGIEVKNIPKVPFSKQELIDAKRLGQELILYVDKTKDGKPLTAKQMETILGNKTSKGEKFLYDSEWYTKDVMTSQETPRIGWRLTSKECIAGSENKTYYQQTKAIVAYLRKEVFKSGAIPKAYQEAFSEWDSHDKNPVLEEFAKSSSESQWKPAAEQLSNLKITQLCRERFTEVLYRMALHEKKNNGERLLDSNGRSVYYTWTSSRYSGGKLVLVGSFDSDGADVNGWEPGDSNSDLGVCLSRS